MDTSSLVELFKSWNRQVESNRRKYPLEKAFHHKVINRSIQKVEQLNAGLSAPNIVTEELYLLYLDNVRDAFSRYNFNNIERGIAMAFVVEAIDLERREFSGYMLAIDVEEPRLMKSYYVKVGFSLELTQEELIKPFRQVLLQFSELVHERE